jgi:arachidonate 15-lipoxygenase
MIPSIPQNDTPAGRQERAAELARAREEFRYNYSYMEPLAFADTVPTTHHPAVGWRLKLAGVVLVILRNTCDITKSAAKYGGLELRYKMLAVEGDRQRLQNEILNAILEGALKGRAKDLKEIQSLFMHIQAPPLLADSQTDSFFAHMRVGGPNPMVIRRIAKLPDNFPVTDAEYKAVMGEGDSLAAAGAEHRLYLADYSSLNDVAAGTFPNGQKYLAAPLALFAVPATGHDRALRAVAIQCGQKPSDTNPVFRPVDGLGWEIAKTFVQMADGNYHQAVSHLGETHLVLEPVVVATCRQLPATHPLNVLLLPHFEGTLNINDAAQNNLMAVGGGVDRVMGGTIAVSREIAVNAARDYPFNESMPPRALASRGVDDPATLPAYPYRDDALLVWAAIHRWVDGYLRVYYKTDADVQADTELQAWIAEMVSPDGGRMKHIGQGGRIQTLAYLIDMVAHIIFIAGPQHAAVNFPQYPVMSYVPNMPLALYKAPPQSREFVSENGYFDWLPPLDMIQIQMSLGYLLGAGFYTQLGRYAATDHGSIKKWLGDLIGDFGGASYFRDARVAPALATFHADLREIEDTITRRNETRRFYPFLLPSRIPQSINV